MNSTMQRRSFESMATTTTAPPPYTVGDDKTDFTVDKKSLDSTTPWAANSTLSVKYHDLRARHGEITDAATGAPLYKAEHRYRDPTFSLNTPSGNTLATACSSTWTMKMAMSIGGQDFELTPRHKFSNDCSFVSPAFGGQTLTWDYRCRWSKIEYILLDTNSLPIARFSGGSSWKCMPWGSFGDFEFMESRVESEAQRDEIVATGLTLAYKAYINRRTSANGVVVVS